MRVYLLCSHVNVYGYNNCWWHDGISFTDAWTATTFTASVNAIPRAGYRTWPTATGAHVVTTGLLRIVLHITLRNDPGFSSKGHCGTDNMQPLIPGENLLRLLVEHPAKFHLVTPWRYLANDPLIFKCWIEFCVRNRIGIPNRLFQRIVQLHKE